MKREKDRVIGSLINNNQDKEEILKVMQAMYLSATNSKFAYEYNSDPALYKANKFKPFKEF